MKIMRLMSSFYHDETERGILQLTRALIRQGHESIVVSSTKSTNPLVNKLIRDGNIYIEFPLQKKSWWSFLQILPLRYLIEKHHPDILHIHSRTPAWIAKWALKRIPIAKRPKVISTVYGFYPMTPYSQAIFDVDHIITVSDSVTHYVKEHQTQLTDSQITRIYRGVDNLKFIYRHNPSVYWLRRTFAEFPELEHKKWLLFPTTIGHNKGQEWLFDIVGNLKEVFPNIHIIIMDDEQNHSMVSPYFQNFQQRAYALGLTKYFTFTGRREDIREWLAASNVVLGLANFPESIGMNVLQALHLGTPVVGWDKGAYSETLYQLYPQGLVKQPNAKALCKVVKSQLQNVGRPAITDQFTLKQMIQQTINVYQQLIDKS